MLESHERITVRQQVEPLQVFTGLEMKNRYAVLDDRGNDLLFAYEESSFIGRQLLRSHRPLTITIIDPERKVVFTASRRFFWLLSHLELRRSDDSVLGGMQRRLRLIGRQFDLYDDQQIPHVDILGKRRTEEAVVIWQELRGKGLALQR